MHSFTLTAFGNLAKDPERTAKGDSAYTRLCLIGNDRAGRDAQGNLRETITSVWFVAFGTVGEILAANSRKGDQLLLEAQLRSNDWTDKDGVARHDLDFVIQSFRFGAPGRTTRGQWAEREAALSGAQSPF